MLLKHGLAGLTHKAAGGGVTENEVDFATVTTVDMSGNGLPTTSATGFIIAFKVKLQTRGFYLLANALDSYITTSGSTGVLRCRVEDTGAVRLVDNVDGTTEFTVGTDISIVMSATTTAFKVVANGTTEISETYTTANNIDIPQYVNARNSSADDGSNQHYFGVWAADSPIDAETYYSTFFDGGGVWQSGPFGGGSVGGVTPDFIETGNAAAWNALTGVVGTITDA